MNAPATPEPCPDDSVGLVTPRRVTIDTPLQLDCGRTLARFDLTLTLVETALSRAARLGATGQAPPDIVPGEAATLARLAPNPAKARDWANLAQSLTARADNSMPVTLSPCSRRQVMSRLLPQSGTRLLPGSRVEP